MNFKKQYKYLKHTVVWTDEGKAYSFVYGWYGRLGHGGEEDQLVPRLISVQIKGHGNKRQKMKMEMETIARVKRQKEELA